MAKIIYVVGEITLNVAVMTSLVAKLSLFVAKSIFVVAEITFNMAVMPSTVSKISSFVAQIIIKEDVTFSYVAKITFIEAEIICKVAVVTRSHL